MIAGIYGMSFEHMPELGWEYGYPAVLAVILMICTTLYRRFRRAGWLRTSHRRCPSSHT
jgi:magnesium transporter